MMRKILFSRVGAWMLGLSILVALGAALAGTSWSFTPAVLAGILACSLISLPLSYGLACALGDLDARSPRIAKAFALRVVAIGAVILGAAASYGLFALWLQSWLFPAVGFSLSLVALEMSAIFGSLLLLPLIAMVVLGFALPSSTGPCAFAALPAHLGRMRGAYLPMLALCTACACVSWLVGEACAAVPQGIIGLLLHFVVAVPLGCVWLASIAALILDTASHDGRTNVRRALGVDRSWLSLIRRARNALSCFLSAALAFSLLGAPSPAWADEPGESLNAAAEEAANVYVPPVSGPTPFDQPEEGEGEAASDDASESGQDASETRPNAPLDYYSEDVPDGEPVLIEGDATVLKTSERTYTTVIGGTAVAFEDERGQVRSIDNTLEPELTSALSDEVIYRNRENSYTASIPAHMEDGEGINFDVGGHAIGLVPEGDFTCSAARDNAIRYTEVREGVDYQYTLTGSVVKEDIVLAHPIEEVPFRTRLSLSSGLHATLEDGAVVIYAGEERILDITAPIALDAAGAVSDRLTLELSFAEDGTSIMTLVPDWEWIADSERAFPVRIDPTIDIASSAVRVGCVEQQWRNAFIGENGYAYAGYDDGKKTGTGDFNHGLGHAICRAYAAIGYDFSYIMSEARIDSAVFSLYQRTTYSGGATNFGLYRVDQPWDFDDINWAKQEAFTHSFVQFKQASPRASYIDWDVREVVNNWVQGVYPQYGFCVKAEFERGMQCELFENRNSAHPPRLTINWSVPDPVDEGRSLDATTVNLRTLTEHDADNKLALDGVFADGLATPRATVAYTLDPTGEAGLAYASRSYKYPDSSSWQDQVPNATRYKDKLSNWQSHVFSELAYDTLYKVQAIAMLGSASGKEATSDTFLVYKASSKDTLPYIANHYGVTLDQLAADNRVQDCLVVGNNTIFVRNPKTAVAYNPTDLTEDQKRRIDSGLMGRGKHCEYGFEPINMNTGNFVLEAVDATVPDIEGDFSITRTYNSKAQGAQTVFGRNWSFAYDDHISANEAGELVLTLGDGKTFWFAPDGEGGYIAPDNTDLSLRRIAYEEPTEDSADQDEGEADPDESQMLYRYEVESPDGAIRSFDRFGMLVSVVSAKGLETTLSYDASHRLSRLTSPAGIAYDLSYDTQGRIVSIALPDGTSISYAYDSRGDLVSHTDATGAVLHYSYDAQGRMTSWNDGSGNLVVANSYDAEGRVIAQIDALGNTSMLAYEEGSTRATDAAGNTTVYSFDDALRTTGILYPDGYEERRAYDESGNLIADAHGTYAYDANGNLIQETDTLGNRTTHSYGERGLLAQTVYPDGETVDFVYDGQRNLMRESSTSGEVHAYAYDDLCRMVSMTDADGVAESYAWEGANRTAVTDGLGNTTSYAYDAMGRCVAVTDPCGNTSRTFYDGLGRVIGETDGAGAHTAYALDARGLVESVADACGNVVSFSYDAAAHLVSMRDGAGAVWCYSYDPLGNLVSETDPRGATTTRSYDARSRLIEERDALGNATSYAYDGLGRVVSETDAAKGTTRYGYIGMMDDPSQVIDALGNRTSYAYDSRGNAVRVTLPDGAVEQARFAQGSRMAGRTDAVGTVSVVSYTPAGRIAAIDQAGRVTALAYDEAGNLISIIDPAGNESTLAYDASGNLSRITDALGNATSFAYDGAGRIVSQTDPVGGVRTISYDGLGNVISQADATGATVTYAYDSRGLLMREVDALGNATSYAYDEAGNLVSETDPLGNASTCVYDEANRLVSETDALGRTTSYSYDAVGNVVWVGLPSGEDEEYAYDAVGNLMSMRDAAGLSLEAAYDARGNITRLSGSAVGQEAYGYDKLGRLVEAVDAVGRTSRVSYDAWGSVIAQTEADGTSMRFAYDASGNLVSQTDALGSVTQLAYDAASRVTSLTSPTGAETRIASDAAGRVIEVVDALGNATSYAYDGAGRVVAEVDEDGYVQTAAYDAAGRLVSHVDALGNTTSYSYDAVGNLVSITDPDGGVESFSYDAAGQITEHVDALGNAESFAYDAAGNMVLYTDKEGAKTAYAYDAHGNLIQTVDALGNTCSYEVSLADTVTAITRPDGSVWRYTYDGAGRMTSVLSPTGYVRSFGYGSLDEPISEHDNMGGSASYAYDAVGNLVSVTDALGHVSSLARDAGGNIVGATDANGATTSYAYDALGQLISVTGPAGSASRAAYDARGNVTSLIEGSTRTFYDYDGASRLIGSTDGRGNRTSYEHDGRGNVTAMTDAAGARTAYSYDALGNLVQVMDPLAGLTSYSYDALGNVTSATDPSGAQTSYGYTALGQLDNVVDADGARTSYSYDAAGNLASVTDALGRITSYASDALGNITSITGPDGTAERLEYDMQGRLTALTTPDGATARYSYDAIGSLVEKSYSQENAAHVSYSYDALGNVSAREDSCGRATYAYDAEGRTLTETDGMGQTLAYAYAENGELASITYPDGTSVSYAYDEAGNLVEVSAPEGTYRYRYDERNQPVVLVRPNGVCTETAYDELGRVSSVMNASSEGFMLSSFAYAYDACGRIASEDAVVRTAEGAMRSDTRTFGYTDAGKLASCAGSGPDGSYREEYSYDPLGNRTSLHRTGIDPDAIEYAYDEQNRLVRSASTAFGVTEYTYDAAGNLVSRRGAGHDTTYEYGVEGRLQAVREGGELVMAATYDGDGNRTTQSTLYHALVPSAGQGEDGVVDSAASGLELSFGEGEGASVFAAFAYGAASFLAAVATTPNPVCAHASVGGVIRLLLSTLPSGAEGLPAGATAIALGNGALIPDERDRLAQAVGAALAMRSSVQESFDVVSYVNSTVGDIAQVMSQASSRTGSANETYGVGRLAKSGEGGISHYLTDGRGSVTQTSGSAGGVTSWKRYSPFGEVSASSGLGEAPDYGYDSEEQNPITGLTYLRARYYDPASASFAVADNLLGIAALPLTLNRYLYCLADPVNHVDPTGHAALLGPFLRKAPSPGAARTNPTTQLSVTTTLLKPNADQRTQNEHMKYTMNLWYAKRAQMMGNGSEAAYHLRLAQEYQKRYRAYYCGNANPMGQVPSQLHEFASTFWLLPVVSSAAEMCAYTAESNGPMTALCAIFSLGECLSLGGLDPVLKLGTAAEKAGALVSKLGGVGAHAVSAAVSLGTKLKEGLGDFVARITEAANNLLGNMVGIGKLVVEGPSGSFHGTGGYTKYEAVSGSGSSGGSGASGPASTKPAQGSGSAIGDTSNITAVLKSGDYTIQFKHGHRHAEEIGMDPDVVHKAIVEDLERKGYYKDGIPKKYKNVYVMVEGRKIEYHPFDLGNNVICVGTYFAVD